MKTMQIGFKVRRPDLFDDEPQCIVLEVSCLKDDVTYEQVAAATIKGTILEYAGLSHVLTADDLEVIPADQFDEACRKLGHLVDVTVDPEVSVSRDA